MQGYSYWAYGTVNGKPIGKISKLGLEMSGLESQTSSDIIFLSID
jgi:hypothetical protein